MVESQYCFELKEVGANLDKEHAVFNLMYLIDLFEQFNPEEFYVKKAKKGRPIKYNPKELLTFLLWAKNNKRESYRDLEKWCENNDETCQLVLKCEKPSKTQLNRFKNNHMELIDKFDQFLIDFAMAIELIDVKIVYGDGTILKAWCNTFKKMYPYEINYLKKFLNNNISNTELWGKLKRYFINEDDNEQLKEELKVLLNEFNYNLNSSGIHLLKLSLISLWVFLLTSENPVWADIVGQGSKQQGVLAVVAEHGAELLQVLAEQGIGFGIRHVGGVMLARTELMTEPDIRIVLLAV